MIFKFPPYAMAKSMALSAAILLYFEPSTASSMFVQATAAPSGIIRTSLWLNPMTLEETLPINALLILLSPLLPITISSQFSASARSIIRSCGTPSSHTVLIEALSAFARSIASARAFSQGCLKACWIFPIAVVSRSPS